MESLLEKRRGPFCGYPVKWQVPLKKESTANLPISRGEYMVAVRNLCFTPEKKLSLGDILHICLDEPSINNVTYITESVVVNTIASLTISEKDDVCVTREFSTCTDYFRVNFTHSSVLELIVKNKNGKIVTGEGFVLLDLCLV